MKKIFIFLGVVALLVLLGRVYWAYQQTAGDRQQAQNNIQTLDTNQQKKGVAGIEKSNLIVSNYGISFTVPEGWHIWEGQSASTELLGATDFLAVTSTLASGKTPDNETLLKFRGYKEFMNNWNVASSTFVELTTAAVDYKDRDLAKAGKYSSMAIDSLDPIIQNTISFGISSRKVDLVSVATSDDKHEIRNIDVNGTKAVFALSKSYKLIDVLLIDLPINSNKYINGKKVQSLLFKRYVKKGDTDAIKNFISLISELHITQNL